MKWTTTNNRGIAFFDIMGFKNRVSVTEHEMVIKLMEELSAYVKGINSETFGNIESPIRTTIFSDSVLIISSDDSIEAGIHLMLCSSYLMQKAIDLGIPLKGCISYGKFTADFDKSLFIGQPLIDAYLLQEELSLYSIIIHHSFESHLCNKEYSGDTFPENVRWIKFMTIFKSGKANHYHLNWLFYGDRKTERYEKNRDKLSQFYHTVSGKTRAYVDNTMELYEKMITSLTL